MSDANLEYEPDNKTILEECCKIMIHGAAKKKYKKVKLDTRRDIEYYQEKHALKKELELDC